MKESWFEKWDESLRRRLRRKNARELPADLMQALRSDLAQMAGSPLPPEPDPRVQGPSQKGTLTKAGGKSAGLDIHLVRARRRTRRADGK